MGGSTPISLQLELESLSITSKVTNHRSHWWKYFNEDHGKNGEKIAACKYCN